MNTLQEITLILPHKDLNLTHQLQSFLSHFGIQESNTIRFNQSNPKFLPLIKVVISDVLRPKVSFTFLDKQIEVELINTTGEEKQSPHIYTPIAIEDFLKRMENKDISELDHAGFDLPWFQSDMHPEIEKLRTALKHACLYYLFPTGESWDFIIPGTEDEIHTPNDPDLTIKRRPKFEIVSLNKTSTPLIQFDFMVKEEFENLVELFPEAIHDPELKNMWVYIQNPFGIDICFVLNEYSSSDWGNFFRDHRLS